MALCTYIAVDESHQRDAKSKGRFYVFTSSSLIPLPRQNLCAHNGEELRWLLKHPFTVVNGQQPPIFAIVSCPKLSPGSGQRTAVSPVFDEGMFLYNSVS